MNKDDLNQKRDELAVTFTNRPDPDTGLFYRDRNHEDLFKFGFDHAVELLWPLLNIDSQNNRVSVDTKLNDIEENGDARIAGLQSSLKDEISHSISLTAQIAALTEQVRVAKEALEKYSHVKGNMAEGKQIGSGIGTTYENNPEPIAINLWAKEALTALDASEGNGRNND